MTPIPVAHFTRVFAAAHRVWNDDSPCRNIHGHNYLANVEVQVDALDRSNFVAPFAAIKGEIDALDHTLILDAMDPLADLLVNSDSELVRSLALTLVPGIPSTEFMARYLAEAIGRAVLNANEDTRYVEVGVSLRETPGIEAVATFAKTR